VTKNETAPTSTVKDNLCVAVRPTIQGSFGSGSTEGASGDMGLSIKWSAGAA
jgi:hypothetical protein